MPTAIPSRDTGRGRSSYTQLARAGRPTARCAGRAGWPIVATPTSETSYGRVSYGTARGRYLLIAEVGIVGLIASAMAR
jgi:hypothetical protein